MKLLLVGEAPSSKGDGTPFSGPSGARLEELIGVPAKMVMDLDNLFDEPLETHPRNFFQYRLAASLLLKRHDHRRILLAGRAVARAFGLGKEPFFTWIDYSSRKIAVIPHPSGRSHWFNDPRNRRFFTRWMQNLLTISGS